MPSSKRCSKGWTRENKPMHSSSKGLSRHWTLVLKNAAVFTDFWWVTFHLDERSATRTMLPSPNLPCEIVPSGKLIDLSPGW
jgi:hypothetical protein